MEIKYPKLALFRNLLVKNSLPGKQMFWSLHIWIVYLALKNIILIGILVKEMATKHMFEMRLFLEHAISLAIFLMFALFLKRLENLWAGIREFIGVIMMTNQVYYIIEQEFQETKAIEVFVHGYAGLSMAFALIFYDSVPTLLRALIYHITFFVYIVLSIVFRREESRTIKVDEYNFLIFILIIGFGTSFVLIKLRYTYLYQKLSFEKTIRSWKKVMNLCDIGISIESKDFVKYRNNKFHVYDSQIKDENTNPSQNYIVINDLIYFAGATSKLRIIKDITEIKKMEQSKFNNLLIATITHELRTPLNIIMAILELFIEGSSYPNIKEDASKAMCAASMQETLINDILDMAKITNGNLQINSQPTEICLVLKNIFELFKFKVDKAIDFCLDIDPTIPALLSLDERRYKQIVFNLLSNACKFTLSGFIRLKIKYKDSLLFTSVKDSGVGIDPKNFHQIFTQFGMLENNSQLNKSGTGLGLNLCRTLSHKMGGNITFKSQYQIGSKFTFSVEAPALIVTNAIKKPRATGIRIVIVDDNNMNIEVIKSFAKKANIPHVSYNNSEKALSEIQKGDSTFIGFFDLNMPNINGYDLARSIRVACKECKLIAVTGEDTQKVLNKCMECGFDEVIEKPVSYKKFCHCLE